MRRTLALAGAAVLTAGFTGLAGPPAAADSGAGIAQLNGVIISVVAAELDPTATGGAEGGYIVLRNTNSDPNSDPVSLNGSDLRVCTDTDSLETVVEFDVDDEIPAGETFRIADRAYAGFTQVPNKSFSASSTIEAMLQDGGAELRDSSLTSVDTVMWDDPHLDCANFDEALDEFGNSISPTDSQTIEYDIVGDFWSHADPTGV